MCVNWLYKGESLNSKGYTVNHVNVLCSSSMKFWCWKSAFSSFCHVWPKLPPRWRRGSGAPMTMGGGAGCPGRGLGQMVAQACRWRSTTTAGQIAWPTAKMSATGSEPTARPRTRSSRTLKKSWRTSQPTARPRTTSSRTSKKSWRTSQPTARPRTPSSRTSKKNWRTSKKRLWSWAHWCKRPKSWWRSYRSAARSCNGTVPSRRSRLWTCSSWKSRNRPRRTSGRFSIWY